MNLRRNSTPSFTFRARTFARSGLYTALVAAGFLAANLRAEDIRDVLEFINGEKLIGKLERSTGSTVTFRSDMAGVITVEWSKIKTLRSGRPFAVIVKDAKVRRREGPGRIPLGSISMTDQTLVVDPGAGRAVEKIPVAKSARVIDGDTFQKAVLRSPGPLTAWKGSITGGASLVEATQHSETWNAGINLVRAIPVETWLDSRNRTSVDFSISSGLLKQPGTPRLKTDLFHAAAEHDKYFTQHFYAFGQIAYDHNYSQGLDLQQNYGGGIGWTVVKTASSTFDLKTSMTYLNQQFQEQAQNQDLVGSTFAQTMNRRFPRGITFTEQLSITPTWNNLSAYAAAGTATLTVPVYKRLSFAVGTVDTFLDNPPPGFQKNSFQLSTGLTYTLP